MIIIIAVTPGKKGRDPGVSLLIGPRDGNIAIFHSAVSSSCSIVSISYRSLFVVHASLICLFISIVLKVLLLRICNI